MPVVISLANMKGGVGKTTLCVNLAYTLFNVKREAVLVVDNDPQFNATTALIKPAKYINKCIKTQEHLTTYNIYERPPRVAGAPRHRLKPNDFFLRTWHIVRDPSISLDVIPSRLELYETLRNPSQKEYKLDKFLKANGKRYAYILIDCPPTPSVLTLSAFAASDYVLIPLTPDHFASYGLPQFLATLNDFKADLVDSHNVQPLGVIFTNVPRQSSVDTKRAMSLVTDTLDEQESGIPVFTSRLSHLKVFEKALWQSNPVQKIAGRGTRGKSEATRELRSIANELESKILA